MKKVVFNTWKGGGAYVNDTLEISSRNDQEK